MIEFFSTSTLPLLSSLAFGFGLGFIHAFDIDHVMAVSVMANRRSSIRHCVSYSSRWALGHGGVLLILGIFLFALGIQLPPIVADISEKLIGIFLIILGLLLLCQISLKNNFLVSKVGSGKKRTPLAIGIIHGFAGNAPVLAMLPALAQDTVWSAISYLLLFSIGLLMSMTIFGMSLGKIQHWLKQRNELYMNYSGFAVGASSIAVGSLWLRIV